VAAVNGPAIPPDAFPDGGFRGRVIDLAGNGGDGNHALLWAIFALLLIVLAVTVVSLVLQEHRRRQAERPDVPVDAPAADVHEASTEPNMEASPGDALAILDARYAAGEVERRDYLRIRRDILGPSAAPS
jgi:uncharacterized membrane protein